MDLTQVIAGGGGGSQECAALLAVIHSVVYHFIYLLALFQGAARMTFLATAGALTLFAQTFRTFPEAIAGRRLTAIAAGFRLLIFKRFCPRL